MNIKVGFIGFGLIGGSIARALKKSDSSIYMMVYSRSINPLMQAKEDGVIDEILSSLNDRLNECDFIFLCAPVEYNESYLKDIAGLINENCIISDVGSVKSYIYDSVHKLNLDKNFILWPVPKKQDILLQRISFSKTLTMQLQEQITIQTRMWQNLPNLSA